MGNETVQEGRSADRLLPELRRLRESEARLRLMLESAPHLQWISLSDGRCEWAGSRWQEYTGLSEQASLGRFWLDAVHPDDRGSIEAGLRSGAAAFDRIVRVRDSAGAWRWFKARAVMRADESGGPPRWHGTFTDVDDLKRTTVAEIAARERAEETLRQSQKMEAVGQLTGGIAHDFNNMLQGVSANLEIVQRRVAQNRTEDVARHIISARESLERAAALTSRLLSFARRQNFEVEPVSLDLLARGMEELIRRSVGPAVRLAPDLASAPWRVLCDSNRVENALLNLCLNARDAMADGGTLTVRTEQADMTESDLGRPDDPPPGQYVVLSVTDTGTGMPPEVIARVFEPFFTTKPQGQGTGLGLSQVHGMVRECGGFLRVESTVGSGTTIRLGLRRHVEITAEQSSVEADTSTVLLVEDEEGLREISADWLRELGYRVIEAEDGGAALAILRRGGPLDLLITDVGLPGPIGGQQVADAARRLFPRLPVLFATGYDGTDLLDSGAFASGTEVIGKPFSLDLLAARVRALLEEASTESG